MEGLVVVVVVAAAAAVVVVSSRSSGEVEEEEEVWGPRVRVTRARGQAAARGASGRLLQHARLQLRPRQEQRKGRADRLARLCCAHH